MTNRIYNIDIHPYNDNIHIIAFGKDYELPRNLISESIMLNSYFSETSNERNTVELELDPNFELAFEWIYNSLFGKIGSIYEENIINAIIIADYLGIQSILNNLANLIYYGKVSRELLQEYSYVYQDIPNILLAVNEFVNRQR